MADFSWSLPYPSQREPVLARNMVCTSQPLAAQAGLQVLRQGGNAVEAAIATAAAMTVLEPTSNGIGSDAFAIVFHNGGIRGLNASGRAPKALRPEQFAGMKEMPTLGWGPITVPGAVSAWVKLHEKFGKIPFEQLLAPAIAYAREGYLVAPQTANLWGRAVEKYKDYPDWGKTFLFEKKAPHPGQKVTLPDHAATLEKIAQTKGKAFYQGELAQKIAAAAKAQGGLMTEEDLASHEANWVQPLWQDYHGYRLHEIPPNGQGLAALMMLGILQNRNIADLQVDCPDVIHLEIEAMKLAFADAHRYIADPASMDIKTEQLLNQDYLAGRAKLIDPNRAQDFKHGTPKPGGTILLVTADAAGNMVSYIQSNYMGFGSGVVIPGTGISMHNRGACFTLEKGHPNEVGGGKRPYQTIIPAFVTRSVIIPDPPPIDENGERIVPPTVPVMAYGVMGGYMQPQGHAQVLTRLVDFHQNPQAALDAPRWQVMTGLKVQIEPGFEPGLYEELRKRGHDIEIAKERSVAFGGGQAIYRLEDGYLGASDLRRDGQAVGF